MGNGKQVLLERSEVPEKYQWKLDHLYVSEVDWQRDFAEVKEQLSDIAALKGKLGGSAESLVKALQLHDDIEQKAILLYAYAKLRFDENTANAQSQALQSKVKSLLIDVQESMSFIIPELLTIPEETIEQFLAENESLGVYRHHLQDILRQKAHVLSLEEEQLLARVGELAQAPSAIFSMINDADIQFPTVKDEDGSEVQLTKGLYRQLIESPDRTVRKNAFEAMHRTYKKQENTLAATLSASIKKDVFYARTRKYESARQAALDEDNIPLSVYDNLLKSAHDHTHLLHRYVALRKKLLGLDDICMYDLYTPMVKDVAKTITFEEAKETILKALKPLGDTYLADLDAGLNGGWIDVLENKGKRSGAYCFGPYGTHPYVLLNHHDTLDHMFTLAHEMGHAMHSFYSNSNQPYVYSQYTIFLAEVASTLNEALLMRYLLDRTESQEEKMFLLNHYMEQFRTTFFRQTMFAEFEKLTHETVEAGEALTPAFLNDTYRKLNVKYYGTDIVIDDDTAIEWARIPHFYYNFYVYKYATGFSAATALSQQILTEGAPAVERYLQFLKGGCSDYSIDLLKQAGVDMTSPQPVNAALGVFAHLLDEMEKLA
ncbi:oligoendopeptidase F [Numidum massiliense]|uniref:oligoendopeptidase F n=1 Tax=Numidum massiliense TaxID=1522315 RepID=UPI000ACFF53E|nr:oligoendopeptidase F [Numidum massiliense]